VASSGPRARLKPLSERPFYPTPPPLHPLASSTVEPVAVAARVTSAAVRLAGVVRLFHCTRLRVILPAAPPQRPSSIAHAHSHHRQGEGRIRPPPSPSAGAPPRLAWTTVQPCLFLLLFVSAGSASTSHSLRTPRLASPWSATACLLTCSAAAPPCAPASSLRSSICAFF
jgi:hypothetical protein